MTTSHPATARGVRAAENPTQILVAVDFSDRAWKVAPLARSIATAWSVPVNFVHIDTASPWVSSSAPGRLSLRTHRDGRTVEVEVAPGHDVAQALDSLRRAEPGALIALATHGRVGPSELSWGSVCESLVAGLEVPVLAVGPQFERPFDGTRRILVCVGPGDVGTSLVHDAGRWAQRLGCPLDVMTSQDRNPVRAITAAAAAVPGTLLVLSSRPRSRPERPLTGSVSRQLLRHTASGVLLLPQAALAAVSRRRA